MGDDRLLLVIQKRILMASNIQKDLNTTIDEVINKIEGL